MCWKGAKMNISPVSNFKACFASKRRQESNWGSDYRFPNNDVPKKPKATKERRHVISSWDGDYRYPVMIKRERTKIEPEIEEDEGIETGEYEIHYSNHGDGLPIPIKVPIRKPAEPKEKIHYMNYGDGMLVPIK